MAGREFRIEWGIRLGKDPALRQQIAAAAIMSNSTYMDAKHFTREMEKAYEEMWQGMLKPVINTPA